MMLAFLMANYWWFAIPGMLLGFYAQMRLSSAYGKFSEVPSAAGLSGADAARRILDHAGLHNVPVRAVEGHLTDHYDPVNKELCLSVANYQSDSLAAIGVAAHEAGHALQHQAAYFPLHFRMFMVPATQFASMAWMGIIILGTIFHQFFQAAIGIAIVIFSITTLFQLVTLPVEFDASRRAKEQLLKLGLLRSDEKGAVEDVLGAAAMTYVAGLVSSVLQLLQLVMMARRGDDRG